MHVRRGKELSASDRFFGGWKFVQRFRWLFRGREYAGNRYLINWQNFAFTRLLDLVSEDNVRFVPELRVVGENSLLEGLQSGDGVVVVALHSRLETVVNRVFENRGINYSVIAISNFVQHASELFGLQGSIDLISLDDASLVRARRKLRAGNLISTCVDFTAREPGTLHHDVYIAEAMFAFARTSKANLVYALSSLSADGTIVVSLSGPAIDQDKATPHALAEDFISFIARALPGAPPLKIGPWTLRTASRIKQHDNYCIPRPGQRAATTFD